VLLARRGVWVALRFLAVKGAGAESVILAPAVFTGGRSSAFNLRCQRSNGLARSGWGEASGAARKCRESVLVTQYLF